MIILGLYIGQCSSIAIYKNNKIIFATSEERFSRIKSDETYPLEAINQGLKYCNISADEIDNVVIGTIRTQLVPMLIRNLSNFSVEEHLKTMNEYWKPKLNGEPHPKMIELFASKINMDKYPFKKTSHENIDKFDYGQFTDEYIESTTDFLKTTISEHLKIDKLKIKVLDHHTCHASYALYGSPIREDGTLIFTADAHGDGFSGMISQYDKKMNSIKMLKKYNDSDFQLGRIYRYTTLLLRMLPDEHEYKVMGLAPYYDGPKTKEVESILLEMQKLDGLDFKFNKNIKNIFEFLKEKLSHFRFDHIAAGLQLFTENLLVKWIQNAVNYYDSDTIVFSGGTSMNVKANMKISQISKINNFFVCGGGGDLSLCMGACYAFAESNKIESEPLQDLYLGLPCNYSTDDINKNCQKYQVTEYHNEEQIVKRLLDGKIIATCIGRSEMGPRALCNRSIIADPRNRENIELINRKIKNRDFWMPFAPVVMYEYQHEIIDNPKHLDSPYMTIGFDTKEGKKKMPVAVHQYDGTARPLILKKETNERMWNVLNLFYKKTGMPALVNTSFNLHGEPIVNSFDDAMHVFNNSGLDSLWLDNHIIDK